MADDFYRQVEKMVSRDPRYKADAYEFLMQALLFTQKKLNRNGHVTATELLEGVREFGLNQYGPLTKTVLNHWGIRSTEDFGNIVFSMVENGLMGKTEKDSIDDFKNVYDFEKSFDSRNNLRY